MHYLITLFFSIFLLNVVVADEFDASASARNTHVPVVKLTDKEQAWLANHKKIRIAFDGSFPPYSFINDSGQLEGIAVDVMNILSKRLGIKFETYPNTAWNKLYEAAAARKVDVVATMVNRPDRAGWFIFTQPYLQKSLVIITKKNNVTFKNRTDLVGKTVTLVKGYQYVDRVIEEFPSVIPYFVDSLQDGLTAVSTGKADAAITFFDTASYQTKYRLTDLKFAAFYDHNSANESIAVRKDWPTLANLLQKGLDTISKEEMQNIYAKWVPGIIEPSTDYEVIWEAEAVFIIVLVLLLLWIARFRKLNMKIKLPKTEVQSTPKILQTSHSGFEHPMIVRNNALKSSKHTFPPPSSILGNEYFFYQDREGIFTYISPSVTSMLGYTADEFKNHYHEYLTDNPVNLKFDESTEHLVQGMPNPPYQLEIYDAQKNIHWLEVTDTPVYDEYGKCIGVDGIVQDITRRKQTDNRIIWLSDVVKRWMQKLDRNEKKYKGYAKSIIAKQIDSTQSLMRKTKTHLAQINSHFQHFLKSAIVTQLSICPRCGDVKTRRSSTRRSDRIVRILFYKSYRCQACNYRFWMVDAWRPVLFGAILLIMFIYFVK